MIMVKMKEKNVDITGWEYLKGRDEYIITFRISDLEPEKREVILGRYKSGFLKSQGAEIEEIIEIGEDLYVKEYYEKEYFENYKSLIPLAQERVVPERLDPDNLEIEVEMCIIEQEMKYRMDHAAEWFDELKKGT